MTALKWKSGNVLSTVRGIWINDKMTQRPKQRINCCGTSLKTVWFELSSSEMDEVFISAEVDRVVVASILPANSVVLADYKNAGKLPIFGFTFPGGGAFTPGDHKVVIKTGNKDKKDLWVSPEFILNLS
jgi:hypothetical protein